MDEQEILAELGSLMDELAALPSEEFLQRLLLLERRDELRSMLAAAQLEAGRDASKVWAEQAARKQPEEDKPFIETHLPDSSMGGGT
jgi:hypothetical protein